MSSHSHSHSSRDDSSTRASTTSFDTQQSTTSILSSSKAAGVGECRVPIPDDRHPTGHEPPNRPMGRPTLDPFHSIDTSFAIER
jgi:hypothetical protein